MLISLLLQLVEVSAATRSLTVVQETNSGFVFKRVVERDGQPSFVTIGGFKGKQLRPYLVSSSKSGFILSCSDEKRDLIVESIYRSSGSTMSGPLLEYSGKSGLFMAWTGASKVVVAGSTFPHTVKSGALVFDFQSIGEGASVEKWFPEAHQKACRAEATLRRMGCNVYIPGHSMGIFGSRFFFTWNLSPICAVSEDESRILVTLSAETSPRVALIDAKKQVEIGTLFEDVPKSMSITGTFVAIFGGDGVVRLYDLVSGRFLKSLSAVCVG